MAVNQALTITLWLRRNVQILWTGAGLKMHHSNDTQTANEKQMHLSERPALVQWPVINVNTLLENQWKS